MSATAILKEKYKQVRWWIIMKRSTSQQLSHHEKKEKMVQFVNVNLEKVKLIMEEFVVVDVKPFSVEWHEKIEFAIMHVSKVLDVNSHEDGDHAKFVATKNASEMVWIPIWFHNL